MGVEGVKKGFQAGFQKAKETVAKAKPKVAKPLVDNSYVNSKLNDVNHGGTMMKHKVQNASTQGTSNVQAFAQQTDPYQNQTAQQIADDRIEVYNNSSNKQDSAEDTGRIIADIALYDPAKANEVANLFLNNDDVRGRDKDELAQEFVKELDDNQLKQIAGSDDGQKLLAEMRERLLSGSVHTDESADASRISTALNSTNGIFTTEYDGTAPGEDIPINPVDEDATPSQGAQFIKYNSLMTDDVKAQVFTQALEAHKDDPEWIANFFAELGPDETADLINRAASPSTYTPSGFNGDVDYARQSLDTVRDSLNNLVDGGFLNQEGMDTLVNELDNGLSPYFATEILAKASPEVKSMFINSAIKNGNDALDASAMHVLTTLPLNSSNSSNSQTGILEGLSVDELNNFVAGAMKAQGQYQTFDDRVSNPQGFNEFDLEFGNVEKLIGNATDQSFNHPPYFAKSSFSEELQTNLFNAATLALDDSKTFDNYKNNEKFENNLSNLFIQNRDAILATNSSSENGSISINGEKRLERFFQLTLMTPPQTPSYDALSKSVFEYVNNVSTGLQDEGLANGDPAAYQNFVDTHGMNPEDAAQLLGGLLGTIVDSAGNAQSEINKDNKARREQIEFFTGLAFAFIPGASDALTSGITNGFVKHFAEEGTKYFQGQIQGDFESFLNDSLANLGKSNPQESGQLANLLFRNLLGEFPNGDAVTRVIDGEAVQIPTINVQSQFQLGFENTTRYTLNDDATNGE